MTKVVVDLKKEESPMSQLFVVWFQVILVGADAHQLPIANYQSTYRAKDSEKKVSNLNWPLI